MISLARVLKPATKLSIFRFPLNLKLVSRSRSSRRLLSISARNVSTSHSHTEPTFGLAIPEEARWSLGVRGLLPATVRTADLQVEAVVKNLDRYGDDELGKYMHLRHLQDYDERLFYRVLIEHTEKMMPIVYTPTVGLACQQYSLIFHRPRGLYITREDKGRIYEVLGNWPESTIKAIVVTDGERILGLGDQGANGMGISVGKLSLYTALAGFPPQLTLPVTIDTGTNNKKLFEDPLYVGLRQERLRGKEYDDLIHEFMEAVVKRYGKTCLIQFEDFGNQNAFRLLQKYKESFCTFNDDIQGTASVAVAGILASMAETKKKMTDNTFLFLGAGEAALGTADLLVMAMEQEGITKAEAMNKIWLIDSKGLVAKDRFDESPEEHKFDYAKASEQTKDLNIIMDKVKPTVLIGVSAQGGIFTETVIRKMASNCDRPVIFALSNPTDKAECTAEQAYTYTEGRCIFASGSPFDPVTFQGKEFHPGQGNNAYIFPAVGLAAMATAARNIPDEVFLVAARERDKEKHLFVRFDDDAVDIFELIKAITDQVPKSDSSAGLQMSLADQVRPQDLSQGLVYPPLHDIRQVSLKIAVKLTEYFYKKGLATHHPEPSDKEAFLIEQQYRPDRE